MRPAQIEVSSRAAAELCYKSISLLEIKRQLEIAPGISAALKYEFAGQLLARPVKYTLLRHANLGPCFEYC
jgi:hypothetical protein